MLKIQWAMKIYTLSILVIALITIWILLIYLKYSIVLQCNLLSKMIMCTIDRKIYFFVSLFMY